MRKIRHHSALVMKVLITRPRPDAAPFAKACEEAGLVPISAPLMDIEFSDRKLSLSEIGALAFTSTNGVRAFTRQHDTRSLPVFAVGRVTAQCARDAGFEIVIAAEGDVESLGREIARNALSGGILHIAGTHRAGDLASLLSGQNISVRREVLYTARAVTSLNTDTKFFLHEPGPGFVCLFSPRTAQIFIDLAGQVGGLSKLETKSAICLSDNVAAELMPRAWARIVVAKERHSDAMIASMIEAMDD